MRKSAFISTVAVFAAFNAICDSLMGPSIPVESHVWYSWGFMATPITGIVLGPYAGFLSSLIGVMIGHFIYFIDPYEFLFTLGAPIGAMMSGFLFRGKWKIASIYYTMLLAIYFITPVAWQLPVWGMWNVYLAYACLLVAMAIIKKKSYKLESKGLLFAIVISAFIGLEADVLFRVFVFIPCQTYRLFYDLNVEGLRAIWVLGAAETPIKATLATIVTTIVGPPLIKAIKKTSFSSWFK